MAEAHSETAGKELGSLFETGTFEDGLQNGGYGKSFDKGKGKGKGGKSRIGPYADSKGKGKDKGKHMHSVLLEERVCEIDQVYTFHFKPLTEPIPFEAGMYLHLCAPDGSGIRHMSFASAPEEGRVSLAMDIGSGTPFKKAMGAMKRGEQAQFFKIKFKHFELIPDVQKEVVFLAGGIGITPIRSLVFSKRCCNVDWRLIHVARDGKHLFKEELLAHTTSLQVRTDHAGAAEAVADAIREKPAAWYYVCGSARFAEGMQTLLLEAGILSDRIRIESFN